MNPRLCILFLADKSMNMFRELLAVIKCMIVYQELDFDPVKEILQNDVAFIF